MILVLPWPIDLSSPCISWCGVVAANGYGRISDKGFLYAHRAVYENVNGKIAPGMHLDHLCRNRLCVNPAHLEPVTPRVNILRGRGQAARNAAKTHCNLGHPFSGDNLRLKYGRYKVCKTCARTRWSPAALRRKKGAL